MRTLRHLAWVLGVTVALSGVVCLRVDRWLASIDIHDVEFDEDAVGEEETVVTAAPRLVALPGGPRQHGGWPQG